MWKYFVSFCLFNITCISLGMAYTLGGVLSLSGNSQFPYETVFYEITFFCCHIVAINTIGLNLTIMILNKWKRIYVYVLEWILAAGFCYIVFPYIDKFLAMLMEQNLMNRLFGI